VRGSEGGVLLRIADSGLGMTDSDRRMANMRLQAGGEVTPDLTPDNARRMGLFVVGRLAARHGIRVGLRGPATGEAGTGTTAEVYLPLAVLVAGLVEGSATLQAPKPRVFAVPPPSAEPANLPEAAVPAASHHNAAREAGPPVTLLPRRNPGSSGITDVPAPPAEQQQRRHRRGLKTPWWENGLQQEPEQAAAPAPQQAPHPAPAKAASDTSAFFARRSPTANPSPAANPAPPAEPAAPAKPTPPAPRPSVQSGPVDDDVIYRRMLSEMMGDPHELAQSADLDWQSVWDRGWSAAAEAEDKPVESHTDYGLPVRTPGARLVPGAAQPDQEEEGRRVASNGVFPPGRQPQHAAAVRDPDAVRAAVSSHFGGVRTGRAHARETSQEPDQE
jgi:hypothetical protein